MDLEFHQLDLRYETLRVRHRDRERRLLGSLAERGQQVPIVVVRLSDDPNRFLVIDGFKRIRALGRLGQDAVSATIWDMGEAEALVLDRSLRTAEGETALEQGWLLAELHRSFGLTLEDLARRFDRSPSWVSRRLALVQELPESVQERVRRGEVGAHAAMKYLVPMARAKLEDCERFAAAIAEHQFTNREIAELYAAWRDFGPQLRQRLLDNPGLFLRARVEADQPNDAARPAEALLRDLDTIGAIARRLCRRWSETAKSIDAGERQRAQLCLKQALIDLDRLQNRMEQEDTHADPGPALGDSRAPSQGGGQARDCQDARDLPCCGQEGDPVGIGPPLPNDSVREGRAVPPGDPRAVCVVSGQSGPSP